MVAEWVAHHLFEVFLRCIHTPTFRKVNFFWALSNASETRSESPKKWSRDLPDIPWSRDVRLSGRRVLPFRRWYAPAGVTIYNTEKKT